MFLCSFRTYSCREHPDYKNGKKTEKEVFEEFLKTFEPDDKDGKVTQIIEWIYARPRGKFLISDKN